MTIKLRVLLATALLVAVVPATAQDARFILLPQGGGANDLTPDGRFVAGTTASGLAYTYSVEDNQYTFHGAADARAVSDDGSILFGNISDPGTGAQVAATWNAVDGWQSIGGLGQCGSISSAYELSADGTVGVGLSWMGCSGQGFRWTPEGGMVGLEMLHNGNNRASVVSADGQLMAGFAQGNFNRTPAIWFADGTGQLLDPAADVIGEVHGMTDDGSLLMGEWNGDAFWWTQGTGAVTFGSLDPDWIGIAMDVDDQGTFVGFDFLVGARTAWIRPAGTGTIMNLSTYLTSLGAQDVPANLEVAQAISTDGRVIIGHGFANAWIAILSSPVECPADITGPNPGDPPDGVVDVFDLLAVLANFGTAGPTGDITGPNPGDPPDGVVDVFDLLAVLADFGTTCPAP